MTTNARLFAAIVFAAIAAFLVIYTWLPARDSLQREEGKVSSIASQPNTWYEVEIATSSGARVTCRTRRGWPLIGPSRCPLEKLEQLQGRTISILHDGRRPYEIVAGKELVLDYSAHRKAQLVAIALAVLLLVMSFFVWKRK